ncbi:hypothetical protein [Shimazuella kribbensis]|uniref:hypothetical protein n=1 Tax=Shimazuella kribbensis TaxID=139808 RepID=UPI00042A4DA1|nr:hypothetical protein [Shimazuella kribbensis]
MKESPVRSKSYARRQGAPLDRMSRRPIPTTSAIPNINILKIMNGFVSFRSTIHDLSQSLQRLESMMDHTTKLFSVGRNLRSGKRPFVPQLPKPPISKDAFKDEEIPIIKLPKMPPSRSPFLRLLEYVDMGKVINILQSPILQNVFTQMFTTKQQPTTRSSPRTRQRTRITRQQAARRNNIRRKRVRP